MSVDSRTATSAKMIRLEIGNLADRLRRDIGWIAEATVPLRNPGHQFQGEQQVESARPCPQPRNQRGAPPGDATLRRDKDPPIKIPGQMPEPGILLNRGGNIEQKRIAILRQTGRRPSCRNETGIKKRQHSGRESRHRLIPIRRVPAIRGGLENSGQNSTGRYVTHEGRLLSPLTRKAASFSGGNTATGRAAPS